MFEPKDFKEQEPYGTCGLSVIAVLEQREVKSVKKDWVSIIGEWNEYANFKDIEKVLKAHNIKFGRKRGLKATEFPRINTKYAIVRVQWLDENGKEYYWAQAPLHTHYVILQKEKDKQFVFCNSAGWFEENTEFYKDYFSDNDGFITSYIEINDLSHTTIPPPNKFGGFLVGT